MSDTAAIPESVVAFLNGARADGKSLILAYVDESGTPCLGLRGSTQIYSPHQLCIWLRNPNGGLARSIQKNPRVALIYRNNDTKTTITIDGRAYVDESRRDDVYGRTPEAERSHDPERKGAPLIIDVERYRALYGKVAGLPPRAAVDIQITPVAVS